MSKSIRFLTDRGFENLITDIQTRNNFEVNANSGNVVRLGKENSDIVFCNRNDKSITIANLAYKIWYEKGIRFKALATESLETALTRKTVFKKLEYVNLILDEFESAK